MAGWQQMIAVGNVGRDPVFKYTPSGVPVCDFSVAVTKHFGEADADGKRQEETLWVNVTCWRKLAELANQYVRKGGQVMVVGTVKVRSWTDKSGKSGATLELTADNFQMLGKRDDGAGDIPF